MAKFTVRPGASVWVGGVCVGKAGDQVELTPADALANMLALDGLSVEQADAIKAAAAAGDGKDKAAGGDGKGDGAGDGKDKAGKK